MDQEKEEEKDNPVVEKEEGEEGRWADLSWAEADGERGWTGDGEVGEERARGSSKGRK